MRVLKQSHLVHGRNQKVLGSSPKPKRRVSKPRSKVLNSSAKVIHSSGAPSVTSNIRSDQKYVTKDIRSYFTNNMDGQRDTHLLRGKVNQEEGDK